LQNNNQGTVPSTAANEVCVKELRRANRKEKVWKETLNMGTDYGKWMRQIY
jgi:hypothetical protein